MRNEKSLIALLSLITLTGCAQKNSAPILPSIASTSIVSSFISSSSVSPSLSETLVPSTPVSSIPHIVTKEDFTEEELSCNTYDIAKYTKPFWHGNIVYNEAFMPIKNENEELVPFNLMYKASEIVKVTDYTLKKEYVEGVDYRLTEDGKLEVLPTGNILVIDYQTLHPKENPNNYSWDKYYPTRDGQGYEYWNESSSFSLHTLCVTYIHNDTWEYGIPEQQVELTNFLDKVKSNQDTNVVFIGDSVTAGCHSSAYLNIDPKADAYPEMLVKEMIRRTENDKIHIINSAIGGATSDYTDQKLEQTIFQYNPDLVIIAFGMNDSSCDRIGFEDARFEKNIEEHIQKIKDRFPKCDILLVPSVYGNPYTFNPDKYESHGEIQHQLSAKYEGVGVADPQRIQKKLLEKKNYIDFMGDNMVHPNDYGMRLIAQTILSALLGDE